jgi:hypothetical protein
LHCVAQCDFRALVCQGEKGQIHYSKRIGYLTYIILLLA